MRLSCLIVFWCACTPSPSRLFPAEAGGYRPSGAVESYTADTLFDLIDGGAEVYRSLNVQKVLSRRYTRPGADEIIVDIFDMGSSRDAFGAYHHDVRHGLSAGIGRQSELTGNTLAFWKDRYFVSIVAFDASKPTQEAMRAMGRAIAAAISGDDGPPQLLETLPRGAGQISYFHDWGYLATRVSLGEENLLGLGPQTEGLLARYPLDEDASAILLVVRYPTGKGAARAMRAFSRHLGVRKLDARTVAFVLAAPGDAEARRLLEALSAKEN